MDIKGVWNFARRPKFGNDEVVVMTDSVDTLDNIDLSGITLNQTVQWDGSDLVPVDWPTAAIWGNITGTLSNQTDLQLALDGKSDDGHTHTESDITDLGNYAIIGGAYHDGFSDYVAAEHIDWGVTGAEDVHADRIGETAVTQHEAAIEIAESQISDLQAYITGVAWGDVTGTLANQTDLQLALDGKSDDGHAHTESDITDLGNYAVIGAAHHDGFSDFVSQEHIRWDLTGAEDVHVDRISETAVTQHESAINVTESQVTDLGNYAVIGGAHHDGFSDYIASEHIDWSATGAEDVHADRVAEGAVTQHEAALSITESQITDLQAYLTGVAWGGVTGTLANQTDLQLALDGKSDDGHQHTESDITDLGNYSVVGHQHTEADITDLQAYALDSEVVHSSGNESVAGEKTFSNDVIISGNLTVNGTTTEVHTQEMTVHDNIVVLNYDEAGVPSQNGGVEIERGTSTNASLLWNEATDKWVAGLVGSEVEIVLAGGAYHDGFSDFVAAEHIRWDLTGAEGVHVDRVAEGAVTQHEAALSITESQISDFGAYELAFAKNTAFNKDFGTTAGTVSEGDHTHAADHAHTNKAQLDLVTDGDHDVRTDNPHTVTKAQVGLGSADNTSDADKPVSTAQQTALDGKEGTFSKNTAFNKDFGSGVGTVCQGNDARLSDARTPTAHTHVEADITDLGNYAIIGGAYHDGFSDFVAAEHIDWTVTGAEDVHVDRVSQGAVTQHQAALAITESQITDLGAYLTAEANDLTAAVVWDNVPNANITQGSVTQHEAALSITESQISDLGAYLTGVAWGDLTGALANQTDLQLALDGKSDDGHTHTESDITDLGNYAIVGHAHAAADITSGTFASTRISEGSVTQHEAALSVTESQISDLQAYLTAEVNDLTAAVVWANVPNANITQSAVTQHQAAISITESQISDFGTYEIAFAKNTAFNKDFGAIAGAVCEGNDARLSDARTPTAHTHTESDITDLGNYAVIGGAHHDGFSDFVTNEHIDHSAVSINGTLSVTGGGDITGNRSLSLVNDAASPGNDKVYGTSGSGVKGWYDSGTAAVGAATGRLNSWTVDGPLYYQDFVHGMGTKDVTYLLREYATDEEVSPDKFDIIDTNTVRVYVDDVGEDLQINVVTGSGPQGPQGPAGDNTIGLEEGGVAVTNTPHDTLDFDATDFNVTDNGDGSASVEVNFPAESDKTLRIGHTWAISGEVKVASGDTDFVLPFFVSLASGQTAKVVKARYKINSGTNCNVKVQKNGGDLTGFTSMTATTTAGSTTPTPQSVTEDDALALVVNSVSGTPTNLSFTLFLEYTN